MATKVQLFSHEKELARPHFHTMGASTMALASPSLAGKAVTAHSAPLGNPRLALYHHEKNQWQTKTSFLLQLMSGPDHVKYLGPFSGKHHLT